MSEDELLLLAFGISEWQTALDHCDALRKAGHTVPFVITGRAADEQAYMCLLWSGAHGEALFQRGADVPRIVSEAREFCTARAGRLDELLREKERDDNEEKVEGGLR